MKGRILWRMAVLFGALLVGACAEETKQIVVPVTGAGGGGLQVYVQKKADMLASLRAQYPNLKSNAIEALESISMLTFVNDLARHRCYEDLALPIGNGQMMLKPSEIGFVLSQVDVQGRDTVLEVGTGTGYLTAVLSRMAGHVYSVEIIEYLSEIARARLERLQIGNVNLRNADGLQGWEKYAPFDVILVTAAIEEWPDPLVSQLKDGGRMAAPLIGENGVTEWTVVRKNGSQLEILATHLATVAPAAVEKT